MITPLLERIKNLQDHIMKAGMAPFILALPAPRMLSLPAPLEEIDITGIFAKSVVEQEIVDVARDLFSSGHYSLAIQESYKAVEKYVQKKASVAGLSGTQLMQSVFSTTNPKLTWSDRTTISEQDEQKGYLQLYAGAMLGIRNPITHEFDWINDSQVALELIIFAQHLLKKAKSADIAQS